MPAGDADARVTLTIGEDGDGRELSVDPRTARVGEAAPGEPPRYDGPMGWPSYVAMLEAVAGALEAGQPLRDRHPTVTAACEHRWSDRPSVLPAGCAAGQRSPGSTATASTSTS
ncbi:hypothetical protein ACIBP6_02050 [Nonomuraea terrae]|uniref:hypothetical protein n=1 Tax=Nonomuraea terrae TaxID=2530383 RepID=UPI0037ADE9B1